MSRKALPVLAVAVLCGLAVLVATLVALGPAGSVTDTDDPVAEAPARGVDTRPEGPLPAETETPPGHRVAGQVTERGGRPVADAGVIVGKLAARTTEDGTFALEDVPPGSHTLLVSADGFHLLETSIGVPGAPLALRLRPFREVSGTVRLPDGRPAPGVAVRAVGADKEPRTATTDAAGRFRIERLGTGRYSVAVEAFEHEGRYYQPQYKRVDLRVSKPVDFEPEQGTAIVGRVLAPDDTPVADAVVAASGYGSQRGRASRTRSGPDGRFAVIVKPQGEFTLTVETPTDGESGFRYLRWVETNLRPTDGPLDVTLEPGETLEGRIVGPRRDGRRLLLQRIVRRGFQNAVITRARSGPDGRFRFGGLGPGNYMISLSRDDDLARDGLLDGAHSFRVPGDPVTVRVVRPLSIAGRVEDAQGRAFGGRSVFVENRDSGLYLRRTTEKDGTFLFPRVPPGDHTFVALAPHRSRKYVFEHHRCGAVTAGDLAVVIRVEQWPAGE